MHRTLTGTFLLRGMLVGLVAGMLVFALSRIIGEPQVERAIAFESAAAHDRGEAPEPEMISRQVQRGLGLFTGVIVYGAAIGGIFGLVFSYAWGRSTIANPCALSALIAALGFLTLVIVPALKYPANPPAVGNADTIGTRTAAYFLLLAFSIATLILAIRICRRLTRSYGAWNASIAAAALFIVILTILCHFLPTIDEVPATFPATLLWRFRIATLEIQAVLWTTLGLLFGYLTDRNVSNI